MANDNQELQALRKDLQNLIKQMNADKQHFQQKFDENEQHFQQQLNERDMRIEGLYSAVVGHTTEIQTLNAIVSDGDYYRGVIFIGEVAQRIRYMWEYLDDPVKKYYCLKKAVRAITGQSNKKVRTGLKLRKFKFLKNRSNEENLSIKRIEADLNFCIGDRNDATHNLDLPDYLQCSPDSESVAGMLTVYLKNSQIQKWFEKQLPIIREFPLYYKELLEETGIEKRCIPEDEADNVKAAVTEVIQKQQRIPADQCCIKVYGFPEEENDSAQLTKMFDFLGCRRIIFDHYRVGRFFRNAWSRPIKLEIDSADNANLVLSRANDLNNNKYYAGVRLCKWLSEEEMKAIKQQRHGYQELYKQHPIYHGEPADIHSRLRASHFPRVAAY